MKFPITKSLDRYSRADSKPPMAARESLRTTMVGPRPNFMPSSMLAITTPAVNSTVCPIASTADPLAAENAGHRADFRVQQGRHDRAQVRRRNLHVAVAGDQNVKGGGRCHVVEAIVLGVRPGGLPSDHDARGNVRILGANLAN